MKSPKLQWRNYLNFKYIPSWLGLGTLRLIALFPYKLQYALGIVIGELFYRIAAYRRHVVKVNIGICFPELSKNDQEKIVRKHFHSLGISLSETAIAWWGSQRKIRRLVSFKNLHIIDEALEQGKGAIILGAHYTTIEISGSFITLDNKFAASYQQFNNKLFNEITYNKRNQVFDQIFERNEIRQTFRYIKNNHLMWIASDQDQGISNSVYAPFFGHVAATQTVPSRMAKVTGAPIIPYTSTRLANAKGYEIEFFPAIDNFPSKSLEDDAARINQVLEKLIKTAPEQYLWTHRRFKTQPDGVDVYGENPRRAKRRIRDEKRRAKQALLNNKTKL